MVTTASIITIIRGLIKDLSKSNGRNSFVYKSDASFKLDNDRVSSSTIIVYVNGTDITDSNWGFDPDTNKVTITSSLTVDDDIMITFDYFEKYSDTELTSYIKSNLARFTQYRYKKRFYMNSSDEIVTDNGANPTRSEGDLIAIITSIDIDPQNINISTRDFNISATEKKSKSELMHDTFAQFNKAYISLDFLEIEI